MLRSIQPIGQFFPQDSNGFIINDTSIHKVPAHWLPIIEQIKQSYITHLGNELHSIYLRGSLARGLQVDGFSDIDTFALIHKTGYRWQEADWQNSLKAELQTKFPFVKDVEIMLSSFKETLPPTYPRLDMIIKTQSLCLFGENAAKDIPAYRPSRLMMGNSPWLAEDLEDFWKKKTPRTDEIKELMKLMIRSGFEIIMGKEGKYTTDLYLCWQSFSKHFPKEEESMRKMLYLYLNPSIYSPEMAMIIKDLGEKLITRIETIDE